MCPIRVLTYHGCRWSLESARLLSLHDRAANFLLPDGGLVSLVAPELGNGPGAAVLERPWRPGKGLDWSAALAWTPPPPPPARAWALGGPSLPVLPKPHGPALASMLARGAASLAAGRWAEAVAALAGLGPGLTPSGDDLLCGYAVALHRLDRPEAPALAAALAALDEDRTTPLSRHLLSWAARGVAGEHHLDWLDSVLRGAPDPARLERLLAHGATSGADWAAGALLALTHHAPKEMMA